MTDSTKLESPSLNMHRRQRFWNIILPVVLAAILVVIAGVFTFMAGAGEKRLWADVAIIWLLAPMLLLAPIGMFMMVGLIYVFSKLSSALPRYTTPAQKFASRVNKGVQRLADLTMKPILWLQQLGTAINTLIKPGSRGM